MGQIYRYGSALPDRVKTYIHGRAGEASAFGVRAAWLHILAGGLRVIAPFCTGTGVPFSQETSNWKPLAVGNERPQ